MTATTNSATDALAFSLREHGMTYPQIARTLGLANANAADTAVGREARRRGVLRPGTSATRQAAARRAAATRYGHTVVRGSVRRFGVEIEVTRLSERQAAAALVAAGIPAIAEGYNHRTPDPGTWKVVYDGSVSGGCEVVSPILEGEAGYQAVKAVMSALSAAGARVDRSTGFHVHHEATDMSGSQIATLVRAFAAKQSTLDAMVAPSRRQNRSYCRPLEAAEVARIAAAFEQAARSTFGTLRDEVRQYGINGRPDARYRTLNVYSFPVYGTLEIRQHQGTLDGRKAVAWIKLGQAFIEAAKVSANLADGEAMLADLEAHGLDAATRRFLSERMDALR